MKFAYMQDFSFIPEIFILRPNRVEIKNGKSEKMPVIRRFSFFANKFRWALPFIVTIVFE